MIYIYIIGRSAQMQEDLFGRSHHGRRLRQLQVLAQLGAAALPAERGLRVLADGAACDPHRSTASLSTWDDDGDDPGLDVDDVDGRVGKVAKYTFLFWGDLIHKKSGTCYKNGK